MGGLKEEGAVHTRLRLVTYGDWVYLYVCMPRKT